MATTKLRQFRAAQASTDRISLLDYVPRISPSLERPDHLAPYAELLEQACAWNDNAKRVAVLKPPPEAEPSAEEVLEPLRVVVAAPPQHGKTELALHALCWIATRSPGLRHAYVTYNAERAEYVSRKFQRLAEEAGLEPQGNLSDVRLKGGTEIRFTSVGGSLTGFTVDGLLLVDDPFKDRAEAESKRRRRTIDDWFTDVARTRRHKHTAIVVMATRWHPEDLSGVLIKKGYRYVNLKAIAEGPANDNGEVLGDPLGRKLGEALWPSHKPPEFFEEEKRDAYSWASLYQGEPVPRAGKIFREPAQYAELPRAGYRRAFGLDLAYTDSTRADWSVCVEGIIDDKGRIYILNVQRAQVEATSFALTLKANKSAHPNAPMRWRASGTEKVAASFFKRQGIDIKVRPVVSNKLTCSLDTAKEWNGGEIMVPDTEHFPAPWLPAFLDVVLNFTGQDGDVDDDVDALISLRDELKSGGNGGIVVAKRRE